MNDKTTPLTDSKGAAIDKVFDRLKAAYKDYDGNKLLGRPIYFEEAKQAILAILAQEVKQAQADEVQHEIDFLLDDYKRTDDYNLKMAANRMEARLHTIRKAGLV